MEPVIGSIEESVKQECISSIIQIANSDHLSLTTLKRSDVLQSGVSPQTSKDDQSTNSFTDALIQSIDHCNGRIDRLEETISVVVKYLFPQDQ